MYFYEETITLGAAIAEQAIKMRKGAMFRLKLTINVPAGGTGKPIWNSTDYPGGTTYAAAMQVRDSITGQTAYLNLDSSGLGGITIDSSGAPSVVILTVDVGADALRGLVIESTSKTTSLQSGVWVGKNYAYDIEVMLDGDTDQVVAVYRGAVTFEGEVTDGGITG